MANPRLDRYPALNVQGGQYRMTPNELYDYGYDLRNAEHLLEKDKRIRAQDRKLIQAFMKHIKAQGVSTGRLAKYLNLLRRVTLLMGVSFRAAKRRDIEDLLSRLSDYEIVCKRRDGSETRRHYSAETMADFKMAIKRFMKYVRCGDTDKDTPYPEEVRWRALVPKELSCLLAQFDRSKAKASFLRKTPTSARGKPASYLPQ